VRTVGRGRDRPPEIPRGSECRSKCHQATLHYRYQSAENARRGGEAREWSSTRLGGKKRGDSTATLELRTRKELVGNSLCARKHIKENQKKKI